MVDAFRALPGRAQPPPALDPQTGLISAATWTSSGTLRVAEDRKGVNGVREHRRVVAGHAEQGIDRGRRARGREYLVDRLDGVQQVQCRRAAQ